MSFPFRPDADIPLRVGTNSRQTAHERPKSGDGRESAMIKRDDNPWKPYLCNIDDTPNQGMSKTRLSAGGFLRQTSALLIEGKVNICWPKGK